MRRKLKELLTMLEERVAELETRIEHHASMIYKKEYKAKFEQD